MEIRTGLFPKIISTADGMALNDAWSKIRARALCSVPLWATYSEAAIGAAKVAKIMP